MAFVSYLGVSFLFRKKFYWKSLFFFARILTVTGLKINYKIKSTEYCGFRGGPQLVAKEKP